MTAALICREFGWTWQEFENQPAQFIDNILAMLQEESREMERKNKRLSR